MNRLQYWQYRCTDEACGYTFACHAHRECPECGAETEVYNRG